MRRVFNKKQLIVMWVVGIVVCVLLFLTIQETRTYIFGGARIGYRATDWKRASLYSVVIVGALLVVTFGKRQPPKERKE